MERSGTQGQPPLGLLQRIFDFIQTLTRRWPKLFNKWTLRITSSINFVLVVFVMATPLWTAEFIREGFTYMGLWSICHFTSCNTIPVSDDMLIAMRTLTIIAFTLCLVGLLTAWDLLSRFTGNKTLENIICATANFIAGICMISNLLVVGLSIDEVVFVNFYLGCLICFLCMFLGKISVLKIFYWVFAKKRLNTQVNPAEGTRA